MKHQQEFNTWSLDEINQLVKKNFTRNYWQFIIQQMNYPEIRLDAASGQITCPTFIPLRDLALEVIQDLQKSQNRVRECRVCTHFFDINKEDGIFGDTKQLDRFICQACANRISAKEFYERHLVM